MTTLADLEAIARTSGRELRAVLAEAEPHRMRAAGPRLVHRRTGLRFCLVSTPTPFLFAEEVVLASHAEALGLDRTRSRRLAPDQRDDTMPLYLSAAEIGTLTRAPFRLPRASEWEAAYRAGTTTRFPWGDAPPSAPPSWHPLGFVAMGWYDELTADDTVRGGAAMTWPWSPGDPPERTWLPLSADVERPWDGADVCVRFALDLTPA